MGSVPFLGTSHTIVWAVYQFLYDPDPEWSLPSGGLGSTGDQDTHTHTHTRGTKKQVQRALLYPAHIQGHVPRVKLHNSISCA